MTKKNNLMQAVNLKSIANAVAHAFGSKKGLDEEFAAGEPGTGGIRKIYDEYNNTGYTPDQMAQLLKDACNLRRLPQYFSMAEKLEEADLQFRSLISTRKQAVVGLPVVVEPFDTSRQAKKVAELVRTVVTDHKFSQMLLDMLDAIAKGVSIIEIVWDTSGPQWIPARYERRDPRWFSFDPADGKTVKMVGTLPEGLIDLPANKFIIHTPNLKAGLPIRGGLAMAAAWAWIVKTLVLTNWLGFCEVYGQPFRIGTYEKGTSKADVQGLKKALQSLGTNAYAVLDKTMAMQFVEAGGKSGSSQLFEQIIKYLDDQIAKLTLGQTLTSGNGGGVGSQALGKVHDQVRTDILLADAKDAAASIMQCLIKPLVELNFGPGTPLPTVRLHLDEREDATAMVGVVKELVAVGLPISAAWAYDQFGIPAPEDGEALLSAPKPPALPGPGATPADPTATAANAREAAVHCPVHDAHAKGPRDSLDGLVEKMAGNWEPVAAQLEADMLAAIGDAKDLKSIQAAMSKFITDGNFKNAATLIGNARAIANVVGQIDAPIGGEIA